MFQPRFEFGLPTVPRGLLVLGLFGAFGTGLYLNFRPARADEFRPGVTVDGAVPHGDLKAFVSERARTWRERKVTLSSRAPGVDENPGSGGAPLPAGRGRVVLTTTLGALGLEVDEERVVALAEAAGRPKNLAYRKQLNGGAEGGDVDVPLVPRANFATLMSTLAAVKEVEDLAPLSARLDVEHDSVVPERPGRYIDADALLAALVDRVESKSFANEASPEASIELDVPVLFFAPRITTTVARSIKAGAVLAEYETHFSRHGDQERRGRNIEVAAAKLDGLVLSPNELVSFNEVVGERSEENGFQRSWEIFKGEMKEGVGGGTCQVASTVHAAAVFSGIDIVERLPHSRPSAYIPIGLDATVVYPVVDMKLRNSFQFPVVVHAKVDGNRLLVQFRGAERPVHVSFTREIVKTLPYSRKIEEKPHLGHRKVLVRQHGIRGYRIERERILTFRNGRKRTEKNKDFYPPTTEIYEVSPGFDVSLLPPIPVLDDDEGEGSDASAQAAATAAAAAVGGSNPASVSAVSCSGPNCAGPGNPAGSTAYASAITSPAAAPVPGVAPSLPPQALAPSTLPAAPVAPPSLRLEDAPGAHAPTAAQSKPPKKLTIKR